MKIAVITSSFPQDSNDPASAAGLFVRDFAVALSGQGHNVTVLTQDKGRGIQSSPPGVEVTSFPWPGGQQALSQLKLHRPGDAYAAWSLIANGKKAIRDLHRQVGFDHVLAMWAVPGGLFAEHLASKEGVPYSVWCLGSDIWTYGKIPVLRWIVRRVLRNSKHRFADGIKLVDDTKALCKQPVEFLPSSRKLAADSIEPASWSAASPRFLFVGRYAHVKGIDILLRAFADYRRREGKGSLKLLGGGPLESELRRQLEESQLESLVTIGGYADSETYISHLLACDAMVIPSRNESIPVVLSDAAQLGKPIIVSDVGDMGRLVRETNAGQVVPADDASALADSLLQFQKIGAESFQSGVKELAAKFDIAQSASAFLELIQREESQLAEAQF